MHVKITINMDNAAFEDGENGTEVARILHAVRVNITNYPLAPGDEFYVKDTNGNTCGIFEVKKGTVKL